MPQLLELEMGKTAYVIARELARIKAGESVLITLDGLQDWKPAEEIAKAAEALGAKALVAWHSTPPGYGKVADPGLPDALKAAIPNTDVWIELNNQWLLYSSPWEEMARGGRVRYLFLGGLNVDQMVRCIGRVNIAVQERFQTLLVNLTKKARKMRITSPAGNDVTFQNDPARPVTSELYADVPGPRFLLGQIAWAPLEESINGRIVYDGSFSGGGEAELGILKESIALIVERGRIVQISGGREAQLVERWLRKLDDSGMYNAAHVCYGFNPGARLSGLCTEDERVWGCTEWGFGYQGPHLRGKAGPAKSHFDGICLNSSIWLDDEELVRHGGFLHPELAQLARQLGRE